MKNSNRYSRANLFFHYAGPVALITIVRISALVAFRTCWVFSVAGETLAMLPAPTLWVVLATFRRRLAEITVF
jgi:hypothetical protein